MPRLMAAASWFSKSASSLFCSGVFQKWSAASTVRAALSANTPLAANAIPEGDHSLIPVSASQLGASLTGNSGSYPSTAHT
jgi:hypothetical protein